MTANELDIAVMDLVHQYDVSKVLSHMGKVGEGQIREVKNENDKPNLYLQWLACLVKLTKPTQIVELGAAAGISTIMMVSEIAKDAKIYSVDFDPRIAWIWMDREYPQVTKILGDTREPGIWNLKKTPNLSKTDIWFFDSLHTQDQLEAELKLYTQFFKKGAILVFDDIHMNPGMEKVWNDLPYDKRDISTPCHWSGFGVAIA